MGECRHGPSNRLGPTDGPVAWPAILDVMLPGHDDVLDFGVFASARLLRRRRKGFGRACRSDLGRALRSELNGFSSLALHLALGPWTKDAPELQLAH